MTSVRTENFSPKYGTAVESATSGTAVALTVPKNTTSAVITNLGINAIYFRFGNTDAAIGVDYVVLPNSQVVIQKGDALERFTAISSGASTVHVICGDGS